MADLNEGLAHLCGAYFHQDWNDYDGSPTEVVRHFMRDSDAEAIDAVVKDIDGLLASTMTEDDLQQLLAGTYHMSYNVTYDKLTWRQWLQEVRTMLINKE